MDMNIKQQLKDIDIELNNLIKGGPGSSGTKGPGTRGGGTFFHGTILPRIKKIQKEGLIPGKFHNYDKNVYEANRDSVVYMSDKKGVADRYARDLSFVKNSTPAIIEIRVPKGEM